MRRIGVYSPHLIKSERLLLGLANCVDDASTEASRQAKRAGSEKDQAVRLGCRAANYAAEAASCRTEFQGEESGSAARGNCRQEVHRTGRLRAVDCAEECIWATVTAVVGSIAGDAESIDSITLETEQATGPGEREAGDWAGAIIDNADVLIIASVVRIGVGDYD